MPTLPRLCYRSSCVRWIHALIICSLFVQILIPAQSILAAPLPPPLSAEIQVEAQPTAASLASAPQAPTTVRLSQPVNPETQPDPSPTEWITPTLPVQINVQLDTLLIAPNETTTLTLTLQSEIDTTNLNLVLMLPAAIVTSHG